MRIARRTLPLLLAMALAGCGWHPVYGPVGGGAAGTGLAAVEVELIPERSGQLLREALKARFERGGAAVARQYDLAITYQVSSDGVAIQRDNSTSRVRILARASWSLTAQDTKRTTLATGISRQVDGYNVFVNQYFAADLESEAVIRRLSDAVAEDITQQLAVWFDRQKPAR